MGVFLSVHNLNKFWVFFLLYRVQYRVIFDCNTSRVYSEIMIMMLLLLMMMMMTTTMVYDDDADNIEIIWRINLLIMDIHDSRPMTE